MAYASHMGAPSNPLVVGPRIRECMKRKHGWSDAPAGTKTSTPQLNNKTKTHADWREDARDCLRKNNNLPALSQRCMIEEHGWSSQNKMDLKYLSEGLERCNNSDNKAYYAKTPCEADEITFKHMADSSKISQDEKIVLLKVRQSIDEGLKEFLAGKRSAYGAVGNKFADLAEATLIPENDKINLDLYNEKITWGEFNQKRKESYTRFVEKIKNIKP